MHWISFLLLAFNYYLKTTISTSINFEEIIDLTWQFNNNNNNTMYKNETKKFCSGERGGTYFKAPSHFNKKGWKVGQVPLSHLIVQGIKIDLTKETEILHHKTRLLPKHLEEWKNKYKNIPKKCVILIQFGWSKYYLNKFAYFGLDTEHNLNFPGISETAAKWIVQQSHNVVGVGVDTASVDPGRDENFIVQKILNENQIYVLENIKIPPIFPENDFKLYVMPMKLEGDGAPLRVVAVPSKTEITSFKILTIPLYIHMIVVISSIILYMLYFPVE